MRYGEIITTIFYGIKLSQKEVNLIDGYFLGASHHRIRAINAMDIKTKNFHCVLYWKHIQSMMTIISKGDFEGVFIHDSVTSRGLHKPEGWLRVIKICPSQVFDPADFDYLLSSDTLFQHMYADLRHPPGRHHPYDVLLTNPKIPPSEISLELAAA